MLSCNVTHTWLTTIFYKPHQPWQASVSRPLALQEQVCMLLFIPSPLNWILLHELRPLRIKCCVSECILFVFKGMSSESVKLDRIKSAFVLLEITSSRHTSTPAQSSLTFWTTTNGSTQIQPLYISHAHPRQSASATETSYLVCISYKIEILGI